MKNNIIYRFFRNLWLEITILTVKKDNLSHEFFRDIWLIKYHNTTSKEVAKKHPDLANSPDWFMLYPCTQEQADKWDNRCKKIIEKHYGSRGLKDWKWIWLDIAPYVPNGRKF